MDKEKYIELINQLLESCDDPNKLDLIYSIAANLIS